ncbi:sulfotransferase family protein [Devosia sp. XJ19-1]|uniref:Sulfotransferase family protein n=1 Tax=Devosia ureilytica TaxID=2952754 RepID=A0A9Q4ALH1_9HYPH|nr:sulfotransferase family 2 domain-containing protein [Devosia ureilytica]MCP8883383.1 sulfotransferase family protein [Devosia ureilytica]MCP8886249.1 sulfotransferase family protein [Devosia ureilytica]
MLSLVSIHVPKTAGTNFIETLKIVYGDRIYMDYGTERDLTAARTCAPWIAANPASFCEKYDVIHGHYHYPKYADIFGDAPVLATLRHPVSRVISQYRHIALHGDDSVERHRAIMAGEMDVVAFSRFHFIGNAQSVYLDGIGIDGLSHAIIQEHFRTTVERFCAAIDFDPQHPRVQELVTKPINSRENAVWSGSAIPVDPAMLPEIEMNCAADLAVYDRALERFVA